MKLDDPGPSGVERARVIDHVVSDGQPFPAACLGGEHCPCLVLGLGISSQKPIDLGFLVAVDNQDAIHELPQL